MKLLFGYGNFPKNFKHANNIQLKAAYDFAKASHDGTNQTYDDGTYFENHILVVFYFGLKFIHLIPEDKQVAVLCGLLCHDVIEDCRVTFNELVKVIGLTGAMISYACTNNRGKTREERANDEYYRGINNTPFAEYVKVCDRLGNTSSSVATGHGMAKKYAKEFGHFRAKVQRDLEFSEMWHHLKHLTFTLAEIQCMSLMRGDMVEHKHAGPPLIIESIRHNFQLDKLCTTLICTTTEDLINPMTDNITYTFLDSSEVQPYV